MRFSGSRKAILVLLLGLISFALYINSLNGDFLIDDYQGILNNPQVHDIKLFFSKHSVLTPARGLLWELSHALIWHFWGANPFYYHLFNVFTNTACVILVFLLCNILFGNLVLSFFTGLIFALHPIHTEAVSWISGGAYVLASLFSLAAFIFYVKSNKSIYRLVLAVAFFTLAISSGSAALSLAGMFIVYDLFFREEETKNLRRIRWLVLFSILLVVGLFLALFLVNRPGFGRTIFYFQGPRYLIVIAKALIYYLRILYLPLERGLYHPFAYNTLDTNKLSPAFFFSLIFILISIVAFFRCRKSAKPVAFGIAWFFVTYLPYSNLVPVCNIISERYMYLPSLGFSIVVAYLILKAWELINKNNRYKTMLRYIAIIAITFYLGSYAALTLKHNYEYRNLLTYWQTNIRNFPDGYMAYNNLAGTYYAMGDRQQAIAYCWVNLLINSEQPHVWCNLGKVYREIGDYEMAKHCYEQALGVDKAFLPAAVALEEIKKIKAKKKK